MKKILPVFLISLVLGCSKETPNKFQEETIDESLRKDIQYMFSKPLYFLDDSLTAYYNLSRAPGLVYSAKIGNVSYKLDTIETIKIPATQARTTPLSFKISKENKYVIIEPSVKIIEGDPIAAVFENLRMSDFKNVIGYFHRIDGEQGSGRPQSRYIDDLIQSIPNAVYNEYNIQKQLSLNVFPNLYGEYKYYFNSSGNLDSVVIRNTNLVAEHYSNKEIILSDISKLYGKSEPFQEISNHTLKRWGEQFNYKDFLIQFYGDGIAFTKVRKKTY